jgi:spore germination protein YaaH
MKLIDENKVAGVAGWKLGLEKESVWEVIIKYVN